MINTLSGKDNNNNMDPLTVGAAFAMAQASVKTIKEAIKLGKDIYEVGGDLTKFFTAQSQINGELRRAEEAKRTSLKENRHQDYYALTAQAMDTAIAARKMRDHEEELKTILIWSSNGDIYHDMVKERLRLEKEQVLAENQELFEKMEREKRRQAQKELQFEITIVLSTVIVVGVLFTILIQWGIEKGHWASGVNDPRIVYQTQRYKK